MSGIRTFGRLDGADVAEVVLRTDSGAEARIITWGAVLRDLLVPTPSGPPRRVVLGLDTLEDYVHQPHNFGAVVGRYANRIARARFRLAGKTHRLVPNENGNQLHGGPGGFSKRVWSLLAHGPTRADLALVSEHGDMGYPGRLVATAAYELLEPATLRITLCAFADRPTPLNLTTHGYFNLDGSPDVRDHRLTIEADHVTPVDGRLIPTSEVARIAGTRFDFRKERPIHHAGGRDADLDINFVLRREPGGQDLRRAACLRSERSGIRMELWTTEPGLQAYDGHQIDQPVRAIGGGALGRYAGLALEPQRFPDGPNQPLFPPCILRPGEVSRQATELRFSA